MQTIPIQSTPSQKLTVQLANQVCQIVIIQRNTGLFFDLYVNDIAIVLGVLCLNLNRLVRSGYLGFIGDLLFLDDQLSEDPVYSGLGSRFVLIYLTEDDLASLGLEE